jgi:hypothetical protein
MKLSPVQLVPINSVRPALYNPRKTDRARLELVKLSLRKLGFVLPLYANEEGEILSGHQRHLAATELGWTEVPVETIAKGKKRSDKGLNLMFNRCTNDMAQDTSTKALWAELSGADLSGLERFPDAQDRFPCLSSAPRPVADLVKLNSDVLPQATYSARMAAMARKRGVAMPILIEPDGKLVNGAGRLRLAAEEGDKEIECVVIDAALGEFARAMTNKLSMDFEVEAKYADILRHNAFRRRMGTKDYLGKCFTFALIGLKPCHTFDIRLPDHRAKWTKLYGTTVLDFGAGLMDETRLLKSVGVVSTPFEPFVIGDNNLPCLAKTQEVVRSFLERIATGVQFHSVFASAILNSIPFIGDRRHVLTLISALCGPRTTFYTHCVGANAPRLKNLKGGEGKDYSLQETATFLIDYERNTTIGDIAELPKVQKLHEPQELQGLLLEFFETVAVRSIGQDLTAICRSPRKASRETLARAIEFEFDLPHGEKRLGLVGEAKQAFSQRLGFSIP